MVTSHKTRQVPEKRLKADQAVKQACFEFGLAHATISDFRIFVVFSPGFRLQKRES
jgi:hypothetical protein